MNKDLELSEYEQNTINDFYENTRDMIDDLLDLVTTKIFDSVTEGKLYTRERLLEIVGFAIRYVKTFAYGEEFNETEKVGVNTKKLKALEIIKKYPFVVNLDFRLNYNEQIDLVKEHIVQEEYELLKEILL